MCDVDSYIIRKRVNSMGEFIGIVILIIVIVFSLKKKDEERKMTEEERYWNEWKKIK